MTAKQKKFITSYEILGDIEKACESTGITKRTFYNWSKNNEEFKNSINIDIKTQNISIEKRDIKKEFLAHYKENLNISMSCDNVGISRGTFYNWVKDDKEFKFNIGAINEGLIDLAESVISIAMTETNSEGKPTKKAVDTARFILSQRGIKRGWGEKLQTEIIMTPYQIAMETKKQAENEIIDVTPEEMKQMALNCNDTQEFSNSEENFLNGLSEVEKHKYLSAPNDYHKNLYLEEVRQENP